MSPSAFQANCYGDLFSLCVLLYASISFALLCDHGSLHTAFAISISLPSHISVLSTLIAVASSLPLFVEFFLPVFR